MSMRLFAAVLVAMAGTAGPAMAQMADMPADMPSGHHHHAAPDPAPVSSADAEASPPPIPADHAADAYFDPAIMARARKATIHDAGGMPFSMLLVDQAEWRPGTGKDPQGYAWNVKGWWGGDVNRLAIESEGEGLAGEKAERAEIQVGWLHALDPWFNVRAGVRQDLGWGPHRTHAALTIEGITPYWFDVEGSLFISNKGEVTARLEGSYDERITQRLILQPRAELDFSAQDMPELRTGAGLGRAELGLRLRYEIAREFAPYVGVNWETRGGASARLMRASGDDPTALRAVAGVRFWF